MTTTAPRFAVALALGPVGRFISAGRRSRDLWYGSRLLSELTRQAAKFLWDKNELKTELWTPLQETVQDHRAYFDVTGTLRYEGPVISNKIRAIITCSGADAVRTCLRETEQHVRGWLCGQLDAIRNDQLLDDKQFPVDIDLSAFMDQVDAIFHGDFLEFYAGFALVEGSDEAAEANALARAQCLRDARKNARVFVGPSWTRAGHLRSSLEPGRDAVLTQYDRREQPTEALKTRLNRSVYGIRSEEHLDAIGLLRRFAALMDEGEGEGEGEDNNKNERPQRQLLPGLPFPPLSRVAVDPWLEGIRQHPPLRRSLGAIKLELMRLEKGSDAERQALHLLSSPSREPGKRPDEQTDRRIQRSLGLFPYDASLLFEGGLTSLENDLKRFANDFKQPRKEKDEPHAVKLAQEALRELKPHVQKLHAHSLPQHYYLYVTADGDGVGQVLSKLKSFKEEQALVKALNEFASGAWKIIGDHCRGISFYVGGDELAAYLPLDQLQSVAWKLSQYFRQRMQYSGVEEARGLSLSLGVVVAHVKHDLRDIRRRGEEALSKAKSLRREANSAESYMVINECVSGAADRLVWGKTEALVAHLDGWSAMLAQDDGTLSPVQNLLRELSALASIKDEHVLLVALTTALAGPELSLKRNGLTREKSAAPSFYARLHEGVQKLRASREQLPALPEQADSVRDEAQRLCYEVLLANRLLAASRQRQSEPSEQKERLP
ncbi:MAG: Cas10/Cmr2 second palm domain-containing protein [Myxococcota bacterium]